LAAKETALVTGVNRELAKPITFDQRDRNYAACRTVISAKAAIRMRSGSLTSGLETIIWRHRWEASKDPAAKQTLLDYNRQDCEALELVANRLVDLHRAAPANGKSSQREVVLTSEAKTLCGQPSQSC
jgi:hypothetical protein